VETKLARAAFSVGSLFSLGLSLAACGDNLPGGDGLDADGVARIHDAVDQTLGRGLATGYSVAIWRDGEVVYAEGFGTRDEAGTPVTADTLFQIGSDTKKITAIALLRVAEPAQTVGELVPDLELAMAPGHLDALTVDALIGHRSGLFDYTPWTEAPDDGQLAAIARGRFAANEYAMMPPGIAWNYANPNFSIAGLVTEVLDGRAWPDIVTDEVFAPLGMEHTYARRDDLLAVEHDVASGHGEKLPDGHDSFSLFEGARSEQGWVAPADQYDNAFTRPAGMVWSTASDQARLLGFFVDGDDRVLDDASRVAMMTSHAPLLDHLEGQGYGYGLVVMGGYPGAGDRYYPVRYLEHGGNTLSMSSASSVLPDQRVAVSVLCNGQVEDMRPVVQAALEAAAGDRLPAAVAPPRPIGPPEPDLASYAGAFTDPNLGDVTIAWDTDHLTIAIPRLTELGLTVDPVFAPIARDLFQIKVDGDPVAVSFYDAPDGTPHAYAVNRLFVLTRTGPDL